MQISEQMPPTERTGAEIPVVADDLNKVGIALALLCGAVRVDVDGEGLCDTDSVRELDEASSS